jgi:5-methylcytosine-specific restriction endonuclease McrA
MIKIEVCNLKEIAKEFVHRIEESVKPDCDFSNQDEFHKKIHDLYLCDPERLKDTYVEFRDFVKNVNDQEKIKQYFDYKTIYKQGTDGERHDYWLMSKLDIKTCPYCNRHYTFTINKKATKCRPQFDHFYPKSKYQYLALSFYNLIPSCSTCNHTKGKQLITINPYIKGFADDYKFELQNKENILSGTLDKRKIKIGFKRPNTKEINKNIEIFGLEPLYNQHIDYVQEIIDKAQAYNSSYYNALVNSYTGLGKQPAEIDRFIWGNYLDATEHIKRPLSKLTKDILEQLGIK